MSGKILFKFEFECALIPSLLSRTGVTFAFVFNIWDVFVRHFAILGHFRKWNSSSDLLK